MSTSSTQRPSSPVARSLAVNRKFLGFGLNVEFDYDLIESKLHEATAQACGPQYTGEVSDVPGIDEPDGGSAYVFRLDVHKLWKLLASGS